MWCILIAPSLPMSLYCSVFLSSASMLPLCCCLWLRLSVRAVWSWRPDSFQSGGGGVQSEARPGSGLHLDYTSPNKQPGMFFCVFNVSLFACYLMHNIRKTLVSCTGCIYVNLILKFNLKREDVMHWGQTVQWLKWWISCLQRILASTYVVICLLLILRIMWKFNFKWLKA